MKIAEILAEEGLRSASSEGGITVPFSVKAFALESGFPVVSVKLTRKGGKPVEATFHDIGQGLELAAPDYVSNKYGKDALGALLWLLPQLLPFMKKELKILESQSIPMNYKA